MGTVLPPDDDRLYYAFKEISSYENLNHFIYGMANLIVNNNLTNSAIRNYLIQYDVKNVTEIKSEMLDLIILYLNIVLDDSILSGNVKRNVEILKLYFKIKEGDFYKRKYEDIKNILLRQFERLYANNKLSPIDVMINLDLQEMFDLSFAQFEKLKAEVVQRAIMNGATYEDLNPHVSIYALREIENF